MKEELNNQELQKTTGGDGQLEATVLPFTKPTYPDYSVIRYCPVHGQMKVESDDVETCPICGSPLTEEP